MAPDKGLALGFGKDLLLLLEIVWIGILYGQVPLKIICTHPKEQTPTICTPGINHQEVQ